MKTIPEKTPLPSASIVTSPSTLEVPPPLGCVVVVVTGWVVEVTGCVVVVVTGSVVEVTGSVVEVVTDWVVEVVGGTGMNLVVVVLMVLVELVSPDDVVVVGSVVEVVVVGSVVDVVVIGPEVDVVVAGSVPDVVPSGSVVVVPWVSVVPS